MDFNKLREECKEAEQTMSHVEKALLTPLQIFHMSKAKDSENIVQGLNEEVKEMSANVRSVIETMHVNSMAVAQLLEDSTAFVAQASESVDAMEDCLAQFGFKQQGESGDMGDETPLDMVKSKPAILLDTPSTQVIDEYLSENLIVDADRTNTNRVLEFTD